MGNKIAISKLTLGFLSAFCFFAVFANSLEVLDNNCPVSPADYVNLSGGTTVFLPFSYNTTASNSSNLTIFHGTNTLEACTIINSSLSNYVSGSRKVIITPQQLNALQSSSCNSTFNTHLTNFKKSGNILESSGTAFCMTNSSIFSLSADPNGIYFDWPDTGNVTIGLSSYSKANYKKYMIAYLMNNPDTTLSGYISSLADATNWSLCGGYSSTSGFFDAGKSDYSSKFKNLFLDVNYTGGSLLSSSNIGWLTTYILGSYNVPIIKVANLSTNKIYLCAVSSITDSDTNSSITLVSNTPTFIDMDNTNVTLNITTSSNVSNSSLQVVEYTENPETVGASGYTAVGRYIGIRADSLFENAISGAIIRVYYTDSDVVSFDENALRLFYYNETSLSWIIYDSPNGGVDTANNYVWANTTHFSNWGIFGSLKTSSSSSSTRSGSYSGGLFVKEEEIEPAPIVKQEAAPTPPPPAPTLMAPIQPEPSRGMPAVTGMAAAPPEKSQVPLGVGISLLALMAFVLIILIMKQHTSGFKRRR